MGYKANVSIYTVSLVFMNEVNIILRSQGTLIMMRI